MLRLDAPEMLARLVGFPTVVGQPNGDLIAFIADYLEGHGARVHVLVGPEGDRSNLFATLGDPDVPGHILSGHVDVVPAEEPGWLADPFTLRRDGDRLIGRGAVDMKGFVAAVLSSVPDLARMPLQSPIHIAISYDEESGCRGVVHLLKHLPDLCAPPQGCFVGEPTGLVPVLRHKGKAALRLVAQGSPGHSSRPDLGRNAIHALVPALAAARHLAEDLAETGVRDTTFAPPYHTVQIGKMGGGEALNIIPESAWAEIEARVLPGSDPEEVLAPVIAAAQAETGVTAEILAAYPALGQEADHPLADLAQALSGNAPGAPVSFGTEAGRFQAAGVPSVVCGPGDIARAHKPEEYITLSELAAGCDMVMALGRHLSTG